MKCPNCDYEKGFDWDDDGNHVEVGGEKGAFYKLYIPMKRTDGIFDTSSSEVFACPSCKILFIDDIGF